MAVTDGDAVLPAVLEAAAVGAPFDVVLMDLYMKRVNGDGALALLRAAGQAVPVVLCTANATSGDAERYRGMGFAGRMLPKPFTPVQMRDTLLDAMAHPAL